LPQLRRRGAVAQHTERADILEIGVAAFHHGEDVIGFPPALPTASNPQRAHLDHAPPERQSQHAAAQRHRVDAANRTDPAVAREHALAQV